jgi:hypothetical protein
MDIIKQGKDKEQQKCVIHLTIPTMDTTNFVSCVVSIKNCLDGIIFGN